MIKCLLVSLLLFSTPFAKCCPFSGKTLEDLRQDSKYIVADTPSLAFPGILFKALSDRLGSFENCNSVATARIVEWKANRLYTAYYTNDDACDGGNSYGVIVKGAGLNPGQSVATIEDSEISCL